jgi:hypothetical protein
VYVHGGQDVYEGILGNMWMLKTDIMHADA